METAREHLGGFFQGGQPVPKMSSIPTLARHIEPARQGVCALSCLPTGCSPTTGRRTRGDRHVPQGFAKDHTRPDHSFHRRSTWPIGDSNKGPFEARPVLHPSDAQDLGFTDHRGLGSSHVEGASRPTLLEQSFQVVIVGAGYVPSGGVYCRPVQTASWWETQGGVGCANRD